jgi:hypothetical protein
MERFASAYGRALFPRRYGSRGDALARGSSAGSEERVGLAPGELEIAMGAGIYAVVVAVEELLDSLRKLPVGWSWRPAPGSGTTPVGCG